MGYRAISPPSSPYQSPNPPGPSPPRSIPERTQPPPLFPGRTNPTLSRDDGKTLKNGPRRPTTGTASSPLFNPSRNEPNQPVPLADIRGQPSLIRSLFSGGVTRLFSPITKFSQRRRRLAMRGLYTGYRRTPTQHGDATSLLFRLLKVVGEWIRGHLSAISSIGQDEEYRETPRKGASLDSRTSRSGK